MNDEREQSKLAEVVALLTYIREVPGSNICQPINYLEYSSSWYS
jgi:hypothetical protein